MDMDEERVQKIVEDVCAKYTKKKGVELDQAVIEYVAGLFTDQDLLEEATKQQDHELGQIVEPMLVESDIAADEKQAKEICDTLIKSVLNHEEESIKATEAQAPKVMNIFGVEQEIQPNRYREISTGPVVIADQVKEADYSARVLLSAEKLQAQYKVPTLPKISDKEKVKLEKRKQRQEQAAEKEFQMHVAAAQNMHGNTDESGNAPVIIRNQGGPPIRDIHLENLSVDVGGKELVQDCSLTFSRGRRYGFVGRNGTGKTSLLKVLARKTDIQGLPENCQVLHVEQEISGNNISVLECVLECDVERKNLLDREAQILESRKSDGDSKEPNAQREAELLRIYERLEEIDAHGAKARASKILFGLSFDNDMQNRPTNTFSGGWRMRVALARALFVQPDLLMLDEPTNHLDLHAVIWLEDYLLKWPTILVVVSHSRGFLNNICTDIVHLHNQTLMQYSGNYNTFEKNRAERLKNERKAAESQAAKRKHLEDFINKFRANAKRASLVQSRIKALERMADLSLVADDPDYVFTFPDPGTVSGNLLSFDSVYFGYSKDKILFENLNFGIDIDSRIALVGANGAGKTTVLKLMTGELECLSGSLQRSSSIRISTFSQHHVDGLDLALTPLSYMLKEYPNTAEPIMRSHLSSFGVPAELQVRNMYKMSGGQKSRVAFAKITFLKPHILLLDEPSNHLDMDAVDALIQGLNDYKGCVLLVSHDEHLISATANELWVCESKSINSFPGTFDDYKKKLSAESK